MATLRKLAPFFVSLWCWFIERLQRQQRHLTLVPEPEKQPKQQRPPKVEHELSTVWHFRSSILDRLEEYFICLRRLRRHDPDSYALFSRIGFSIPAEAFAIGSNTENRAQICDAANRWTFGGFAMPANHESLGDKNLMLPSFVYFTKLKRPSNVERFRGDVYSLTALYDDRDPTHHWHSKFSAPVTCHIGVDEKGEMRLLKDRTILTSKIQPGRKKRGGHKPSVIDLRSYYWGYPTWLDRISKDRDETPEIWATNLLVMALVTHVRALEKIIIRVNHNDLVACFGVELATAKRFFADREKMTALARDGKRKRIFHSVTAHHRNLPTGRVTDVRFHYRGLRHFDWQNYKIDIVFPDNNRALAFSEPSRLEEDIAESQHSKWRPLKEAGELISEVLAS